MGSSFSCSQNSYEPLTLSHPAFVSVLRARQRGALAEKKGKKMKARTTLLLLGLLCAMQARAHGGLIDLSVYDRTDGKRLAVYWHGGRAYVVGKPGNEYQVSVKNRLREDVLAIVSVDGVNVVSGETAHPSQTGYVLSSYRSYDIPGWRKSLAEPAAFYFTALPDSYAARTGRPDNVGVIGVAVFRRKQEPQPIAPAPHSRGDGAPMMRSEASAAAAERSSAQAKQQEDSRLGTGHGRRETSYVQNVAFERATPGPAETITLYYDSYRKREPQPIAPAPHSRGDGAPMMRSEASAAAAERSSAQAKQQEDSRLGTGHGRRETSYVQNVAFERATPGPAETITLYYDSYR